MASCYVLLDKIQVLLYMSGLYCLFNYKIYINKFIRGVYLESPIPLEIPVLVCATFVEILVCTMFVQILMCSSRKHTYCPHSRDWGFCNQWLKKKSKEMYEVLLEFPEWKEGGLRIDTFLGRDIDIFWTYTVTSLGRLRLSSGTVHNCIKCLKN